MSIRLRLTLLYSAILALTLMLFSGALYAIQSRSTLALARRDLEKVVSQINIGWSRLQRDPNWRPPMLWMAQPNSEENQRARQLLQPLMRESRPRDMVHILNAEGEPIAPPMNADTSPFPLTEVALARLQSGRVWITFAHDAEGRVLVYNQPLDIRGNVVGIVQLGRSLADRDRNLRALGLTLLLGSALTTLIAFGVGWTLSSITLRPIHRITQTAREIGEARDFSSRVAYEGPNDELGHLATTFNQMLSQLEEGYRQVTHALQVQRDFVADVSHELRTPLTTIRGNLTLLRRKPPLPQTEQHDILDDLIAESERLSRLVTDLLALARADAGRALPLSPVALGPLVEEVCRQARVLAPEREVTCDDTAEASAIANEDALKQILLILLDNAIKHARGPITVALDTSNYQVIVRVQDSGPGMSPELQMRIFDRFYRGDISRSTPGFGLGLSIARALTKAQKGELHLESALGEGSTFVITLPAAEE